jgi:hypothetical protein
MKVLERAVQLGVDGLRRRVRAVMPDDALLQGGARRCGFRLEAASRHQVPAAPQPRLVAANDGPDRYGAARDSAQLRVRGRSRIAGARDSIARCADPATNGSDASRSATSPDSPRRRCWPIESLRRARSWRQVPCPPRAAAGRPLLLNDPSGLIPGSEGGDRRRYDAQPPLRWATTRLTVAARDNAPSDPMTGDPDVTTPARSGRGLTAFRPTAYA